MATDVQLANGHKGAADLAALAATFYNTFRAQATVTYIEQLTAIMVRQLEIQSANRPTPAPAGNDFVQQLMQAAIARAANQPPSNRKRR